MSGRYHPGSASRTLRPVDTGMKKRRGRRRGRNALVGIDPGPILEARRQETLRALRQWLQDARDERTTEVGDAVESSELGAGEDIELGLIRLKVDTLNRINEALRRVHNRTYGLCVDCQGAISLPRLRALPFASRCKTCEEERERAEHAARKIRIRVSECSSDPGF